MNDKIFYGSLARITDFEHAGFDLRRLPRKQWEAGDYVCWGFTTTLGPALRRVISVLMTGTERAIAGTNCQIPWRKQMFR